MAAFVYYLFIGLLLALCTYLMWDWLSIPWFWVMGAPLVLLYIMSIIRYLWWRR